ncbi:MAG: zinc metallopeptidase [Bacteroidales bacterium]
MGMYYPEMIIAGVVFAIISSIVQGRLTSKFSQYSKVPLSNRMTGADVANKMLNDNGISDVRVISTPGQLTDHYDPRKKTVNLSESVYGTCSVAAAAVAAHECGHAVQHAQSYRWVMMRSNMVPLVNISSKMFNILIIAGVFVLSMFNNPMVLWLGVLAYGATTLFSVITLPVEYDASNRALKWLEQSRILSSQEHTMGADALKWAARTYLVAALSSIVTLLLLVMRILGRRR